MKQVLVLLLVSLFSLSAPAETVVVVSANSSITAVSREQLANLYLGLASSLADGQRVIPVEQAPDKPAFQEFHRHITGKSPIQVRAYWAKVVFSGVAVPPRELDVKELLRFLKDTPSAIGYIDRHQVDASLKVVYRIN